MTDAEFLDEIERIETAQCKRDGRIMFGAYPLSRTERDRLVALAREAGERLDAAYNQIVEMGAILDAASLAMRGEPVSDFMESFGVVRTAIDMRRDADDAHRRRADSELLGKVEKWLRQHGLATICVAIAVDGREVGFAAGFNEAPTLADALRALVGETT